MTNKKKTNTGMHPEEIKAAIRMKGVTLTSLAVSWGYEASAIRAALVREMPGVEPRIAKFIGKTLHEIWPDRYTAENIRIRHLTARKSSRTKSQSHAQKQK